MDYATPHHPGGNYWADRWTHLSTLLDVLEERDWAIRLSVLKIMGALQGLARLMDVLGDNREIIRNEVLLVLVALTQGSLELNKGSLELNTGSLELNTIMAFEGAFDTLLGIAEEEEDGSVIASDCLVITGPTV
ncbi:hypothetical protein T484DRAFT_1856576 [Baffinella frigidus]|nr:hypothetical protein T484DRAFT_1856576 [Cryptophyta sp. CCMP2293]